MKQTDLDKITNVLGTDSDEEAAEAADAPIIKEFDDEIENSDIAGLTAAELESLLHELTARRLVEAMRRGEPGAGMIQAARGFLRDNEVTGLDLPGSAQAELKKRLNKDAPFKLTGTEN